MDVFYQVSHLKQYFTMISQTNRSLTRTILMYSGYGRHLKWRRWGIFMICKFTLALLKSWFTKKCKYSTYFMAHYHHALILNYLIKYNILQVCYIGCVTSCRCVGTVSPNVLGSYGIRSPLLCVSTFSYLWCLFETHSDETANCERHWFITNAGNWHKRLAITLYNFILISS